MSMTQTAPAPPRRAAAPHIGRRRPTKPAGEEGVSAVVSAVLLFTLFSTAFLVWSVDTLPQWVEDREHNHAAGAGSAFSRIGAELDATPVGQTASVGITLAPGRIPLLQSSAATGMLEVEPGFRFAAAFDGGRPFMVGGAMVATPAGLPSASNVATLRALEVAYDGPGNNQDGHTQFTAYRDADEDGVLDADEASVVARVGKRSGNAATICGNAEAYIEVRSGSGPLPALIATQALACSPATTATFSVNLLAQEHRFASLLGRLGDDFSFASSSGGAGGSRVAVVWSGTDGATRTAGSGALSATDLEATGDRLALRAAYQEAPQRTVALEGGGVVNVQDAGQAFAQTPVFSVVQDAGQGHLRWRVVDISGEGSVAGTGTATVRLTKTAVSEYVVRVEAGGTATFSLDTVAPGAWQQLWADARVLAGFDVADMATSGSTGTATLTLANIPWTVHLSVIHADVSVT